MKYIRELLVILLFVLLGEVLSRGLNLPLPGNIVGMLLLLAALLTGKLKIKHIEGVSNFLLSHMALLFVPAGVGILTVIGSIQSVWYWLVLIAVLSTLLVMVATALVVKITRKMKRSGE